VKFKDEDKWNNFVKINSGHAYSRGVVDFAERWANLMEERMNADGLTVVDVAKKASHDADTDGLTGFMYGCAVSTLSETWEYGEDLRRWHNLDTQIRNEGEIANEKGGVLNPAIMSIG
jgi:hypothetical protein